jgi:hypothetical protein
MPRTSLARTRVVALLWHYNRLIRNIEELNRNEAIFELPAMASVSPYLGSHAATKSATCAKYSLTQEKTVNPYCRIHVRIAGL